MKGPIVISVSGHPQFGAEDIYEVEGRMGRVDFEFDKNLIDACRPYLRAYASNALLAEHLIASRIIGGSDINLSTQDALIVRFKTQKGSFAFIKRLNAFILKCIKSRGMSPEDAPVGIRRKEKKTDHPGTAWGTVILS
jgi:hypothetical protein